MLPPDDPTRNTAAGHQPLQPEDDVRWPPFFLFEKPPPPSLPTPMPTTDRHLSTHARRRCQLVMPLPMPPVVDGQPPLPPPPKAAPGHCSPSTIGCCPIHRCPSPATSSFPSPAVAAIPTGFCPTLPPPKLLHRAADPTIADRPSAQAPMLELSATSSFLSSSTAPPSPAHHRHTPLLIAIPLPISTFPSLTREA